MRRLNSTSVTKAHLGNGPAVMRRLTSFFPSWFLAGPWLKSSAQVGIPVPDGGLYFGNPREDRQAECLMKTQEQKPGMKACPAEGSPGYQPGLVSLVPLANPSSTHQ